MLGSSSNSNGKVQIPNKQPVSNQSSAIKQTGSSYKDNSALSPQKPGANNSSQKDGINSSAVSGKTTTSTTVEKKTSSSTTQKQPLPAMIIKGPVYNSKGIPKNTDPSMGGEEYNPPGCPGPQSYFNFYCKNTPENTNNVRIIPWDHNKKDYVYAAVKEEDLRGSSRRDLKREIDIYKDAEYWDPVSTYNLAYAAVIVVFILCLVGILIYIIISFESAKKYWYVLVSLPIIVIIIGAIIILALRNRSNKLTFVRKATLDDHLERKYRGSTTQVRTGEASSYLEVYQRSSTPPPPQVTGEPIKGSIASMNTKTSQNKPINLMEGDDLHDTSTVKLNAEKEEFDREVKRSSGLAVNVPQLSPMSQKKLSFQQRLEGKKSGTATPVNVGSSSMAYGSVKPEQEMVIQPNRNFNLMLDDDVLN